MEMKQKKRSSRGVDNTVTFLILTDAHRAIVSCSPYEIIQVI